MLSKFVAVPLPAGKKKIITYDEKGSGSIQMRID